VNGQTRLSLLNLAVAAGALGVAAVALLQRPTRLTHLQVERLDIVEPDGQLDMTLANTDRLPDPLVAGRTVASDRAGPGMLFFDGKGWEVGGISFGTGKSGEASGHFSFDQFHNDQVVFMTYADDGVRKEAGLHVMDRARQPTIDKLVAEAGRLAGAPAAEREAADKRLANIAAERVFVGSTDENAVVSLADRAGQERIRMRVDPGGDARIEFLDEHGEVVDCLPHPR
jgi:hypothetical protein